MMNARRDNGATMTKGPVKLLLVDDLEDNLVALSALLRSENIELLQARSGAQALELLLQHEVALAFLDVHMPDMDGFQLAELMRGSERTRHVPLIFVTAAAQDQHRLFKGYETGAVDFLYKPVEPHILKSKVEVFIQLHLQKRQLAQQLRERTEALRLNEMFLAVLGHDLRNPLNAILMSAGLLQRVSKEPAVHSTAELLLSSGKRMGRMIEDMLDVARTRQPGGMPIRCERTDMGALLRRTVGELQAAFPERRIDIEEQGDLKGEWDADRLAQVASNLIGNAIQHGDPAEPVLLRIDGSAADRLRFSVRNAGAIPSEVMPYLFDPFRAGLRHSRDGLGLGLYIVRQIVQAHGGCIEASIEQGSHTLFRVEVPRVSASSH